MNPTEKFGPGCPWYGMYEQFGASNVKWCEETLCAWINEPANTWTNLAYIIAAVVILKGATSRMHSLYGWIVFWMGSLSFLFHATNNFLTQLADFFGMFLFICLLGVLNFRRLGLLSEAKQNLVYGVSVTISLGLVFLLRALHIPYQILIVIGGLVVLGTEAQLAKKNASTSYRPLFAGVGFILAGAACSALDAGRHWCDPSNHWLQGHATWHVLSAIGIYLSYRFYRQFQI